MLFRVVAFSVVSACVTKVERGDESVVVILWVVSAGDSVVVRLVDDGVLGSGVVTAAESGKHSSVTCEVTRNLNA